jgi:hypothetical protein
MGVVGIEQVRASTGEGHYNPGQIYRNNTFKFDKGSTVYLLDMPDGKVLVMQSWTNHVNKGETKDNLKDLASQFKTFGGWKFRVKVLDKDLTFTLAAAPPMQTGQFQNTYQGCGHDAPATTTCRRARVDGAEPPRRSRRSSVSGGPGSRFSESLVIGAACAQWKLSEDRLVRAAGRRTVEPQLVNKHRACPVGRASRCDEDEALRPGEPPLPLGSGRPVEAEGSTFIVTATFPVPSVKLQ